MTSCNLSIGLIDEKSCPMEAIKYAESAGGVSTVAIQPQSVDELDKAIEQAKDCDVIIIDCKLLLDDVEYPCFSPDETVDGIAMSTAAKAIYLALKEMGKLVIGISAECPEESCPFEMLKSVQQVIQKA